jgi:hypothetical protein
MRDRAANANVVRVSLKDEAGALARGGEPTCTCAQGADRHCFGIVIYNENTNSKLRRPTSGVEDHRLNCLA